MNNKDALLKYSRILLFITAILITLLILFDITLYLFMRRMSGVSLS
jgi:hypothetical protein